ncbi:hypothetical protein BJ875DRAFT_460754 [Amylocarpus encephaloides]|uniref:Uncharacterized protein n=1 Tax=Amylocarpus encephaloides TaxID=45428 RepID=A0A9P8C5M1_9HELO|nr:hypothetical protein BJ875DRAFT_460754 [Amylocarpus encephaloides]
MSRFWPHTAYAEDQPYSHSILWVHVLTRAISTGTVVGTGITSTSYLLRQFKILSPSPLSSTFTGTLLRSQGVGAVVATGLLVVGLPVRMAGRTEIEWQDRSWRLLENKWQVECDDWTYAGMAGGAMMAARRGGQWGWKGRAGIVGAGSLVGMLGYMGWRYGVKGGKFEEEKL